MDDGIKGRNSTAKNISGIGCYAQEKSGGMLSDTNSACTWSDIETKQETYHVFLMLCFIDSLKVKSSGVVDRLVARSP